MAASALAKGALVGAGLEAEPIEVSVLADPPFKLVLLEADAARIGARNGTWRGISFESLEASVTGLRLGEAPARVEARLEGVELPEEGGAPLRAAVILASGPVASLDLTIVLARDEVERALRQAIPEELRAHATAITLTADGVLIGTATGKISGRLALGSDGSLDLRVALPDDSTATVTVLRPSAALPVELQAVTIEDGTVRLEGTIDGRSLAL